MKKVELRQTDIKSACNKLAYRESVVPISQTSDITCRLVYKQILPMGKIPP